MRLSLPPAVGAVDDLGIVTALNKHIKKLKPHFHHTLVDEVQDLGTLELEIIRKLTFSGADDLFLCGDAAQSVQTKHADFKSAGINISSKNSISLKQNYRNSSQILSAAYDVLTKSFEKIPSGTVDIEILPPEYANFSSPNPALLKAKSVKDELGFLLSKPAINAWIRNKWLRPHNTYSDYLVLTKLGIDECMARVIDFRNRGVASSRNLRVSKDRVNAFRMTILNGPGDLAMSQGHTYLEKTFKDF